MIYQQFLHPRGYEGRGEGAIVFTNRNLKSTAGFYITVKLKINFYRYRDKEPHWRKTGHAFEDANVIIWH